LRTCHQKGRWGCTVWGLGRAPSLLSQIYTAQPQSFGKDIGAARTSKRISAVVFWHRVMQSGGPMGCFEVLATRVI
jgi:hypothetical protein